MSPIPPGATIGILGGGQLGRMAAMAAARLGYRCHVLAPEADSPAADVATAWTRAAYDDDLTSPMRTRGPGYGDDRRGGDARRDRQRLGAARRPIHSAGVRDGRFPGPIGLNFLGHRAQILRPTKSLF